MLIKQPYIYGIFGAVIGLCAILILNTFQNDSVSARQYQHEISQLTGKINALTQSMNSMTKLTLQLDKSFKQQNSDSSGKLPSVDTETLNRNDNPVKDDNVHHTPLIDNSNSDDFFNPSQFQDNQNSIAVIANDWQIKQQENQLVSSFENHFSNQSTDTTWAQSTEQALQSALNDDIFSNSQFNNISCRASLCKIDTQHKDIDSELVFLEQINSKAGFNDTESFYTRDIKASGSIIMTLYISRDGHRLPRFSTSGDIIPG